ncbi:glycerol ethanol, ferric requiring protein, partial [Ascosphaera acerosa]
MTIEPNEPLAVPVPASQVIGDVHRIGLAAARASPSEPPSQAPPPPRHQSQARTRSQSQSQGQRQDQRQQLQQSHRNDGRRFSTLPAMADDLPSQNDAMTETFSKIKRYEDFSTIDWVQDAVYEVARRRVARRRAWSASAGPARPTLRLPPDDAQRRQEVIVEEETETGAADDEDYRHSRRHFYANKTRHAWLRGGAAGWRRKLYETYDAGQRWLVLTIVGTAIGLISAILNIITEWLSDIKLGHCRTAWYLNESFCCWGEEGDGSGRIGKCDDWQPWTSFGIVNYALYVAWAVAMAACAGLLVNTFEPYAAGSGISEIKVIVAGFVMKGFLGARTLAVKSITLPLAIGSGLSVGKEGPSVHFAACAGNVFSGLFEKYRRSKSKMREILTASSAAGVAVAFGSPIGGVLFALEEVASYFPLATLWRSYYCALVAVFVLALINPFRTGQLVMFQVTYDRTWHLFELIFFVLLGVFGGMYGAFVIKWNLRATAFRKKHLAKHPILEATVLAALTAVICFPNTFLKINMTEMMEVLFAECRSSPSDHDGICEARHRWVMIASLLFATAARTGLVIITYGCKVPAGIFVPSMAIGASFGRMVGILVQSLHESYPDSALFTTCQPDVPCITPGTYAFLGAGAALSGIMHLTISVVVIMFELTGATTYILPTMIVVGVTKVVSDLLSPGGGIADRMITVNGLPFLDNKETYLFGVPVSHAMISRLTTIPATGGMTIRDLQALLANRDPRTGAKTQHYQGWPVVLDHHSMVLVGWIGRMELEYAIHETTSPSAAADTPNRVTVNIDAHCHFIGDGDSLAETRDAAHAGNGTRTDITMVGETEGSVTDLDTDGDTARAADSDLTSYLDFRAYVDRAPITVHPNLPLETAVEIFKKLGPRVVLVVAEGKLHGLLTVKDLLKYSLRAESTSQGASEACGPTQGVPLTDGPTEDRDEGRIEAYAWKIIQLFSGTLRSLNLWRDRTSRSHAGYEHVRMDSSASSSRLSLDS